MIGWLNYVTRFGATLFGGGWQPGLPLENIRDIDWRYVAESVDNNPLNTAFGVEHTDGELTTGLIHIGGIQTVGPAISTATMRVITYNGADLPNYDSGVIPVWTGTQAEWDALGRNKYIVLPQPLAVQTFTVDFVIPSGVLQVGCVGSYLTISSSHNLKYGWSVGAVDPSDIGRIPGGSPFITKQTVRRRLTFGLPINAQTDDIASFQTQMSINGRSQPIVAVLFPDDANLSVERRAIYGTQADDPILAQLNFRQYETNFVLDQI